MCLFCLRGVFRSFTATVTHTLSSFTGSTFDRFYFVFVAHFKLIYFDFESNSSCVRCQMMVVCMCACPMHRREKRPSLFKWTQQHTIYTNETIAQLERSNAREQKNNVCDENFVPNAQALLFIDACIPMKKKEKKQNEHNISHSSSLDE